MSKTIQKQNRSGFTLIELLVVIAIIGLLAGLIIPAVMGAVKSAQQGAYKLEVDTLAEAVEKYRSKYGDYPPDGSNWSIMERHLRKAFPQILDSELALMSPVRGNATSGYMSITGNTSVAVPTVAIRNDFDTSINLTYVSNNLAELKVMDPAEALVFFLGGFSADPQRPFTGTGGPFVDIDPSATSVFYSYNIQRTNPLFEFNSSRLSLVQDSSGGFTTNLSNDEREYYNNSFNANGDLPNDLLPVYVGTNALVGIDAPFVYFDSRTYVGTKGGGPYIANYQPSPRTTSMTDPQARLGAVRPVASNAIRVPSRTTRFSRYSFMEDGKFQVIGPGVDGSYGGLILSEIATLPSTDQANAAAMFVCLPTGDSWQDGATLPVVGTVFPFVYSKMILVSFVQMPRELKSRSESILDNAANFSGRTFRESVTVGSP